MMSMTLALGLNSKMASFHIQTFGCQMNARDSQWLAAALVARGFVEAGVENADVCILNTCSVREKPERKTRDAIGRMRQKGKNLKLIAVLGCVGQQAGENLFDAGPEVRLVGGGDCMAQIPDAIMALLENPADRLALLDFCPEYEEREVVEESCPGGSAFVNIMQGCDNFCSYCIVPFTRGRQKSRSKDAILRECQAWLDKGAVEITLLGQNVNVWGDDKKDLGRAFAGLLREISSLGGLRRLRFVTPHPADMGPDVVACFGELDNLCPRLHLPLQAGSDRILQAMRRRHGQQEYLRLVAALRAARPDIAISTDLIVGFPGEAEEDFQQTLEMLEKCAFMSSYSFCYSDRPGARSALMPDKIPQDIKLMRLSRLQARQEALAAAWLATRLNAQAEILIEGPSPRGGAACWQGRDIYGMCVNVDMGGAQKLEGSFVNVKITEVKKHSLAGVLSQE